MAGRIRHRWDLTPTEAVTLQRNLAGWVRVEPLLRQVRFVAGSDCSFTGGGASIIAAWVVWDQAEKQIVERVHVVRDCTFPYVPGLLSFREAPAVLDAAALLRRKPDAYMVDGQGMAHPRRLGLASHVGLVLDAPTVGCAKSRLCGAFVEPAMKRGSSRRLTHQGETIGRVVRTRDGVKPLFVSVGHRVSLEDAQRLVLRCCTKYRLPEPTRQAHQYVSELKREVRTR